MDRETLWAGGSPPPGPHKDIPIPEPGRKQEPDEEPDEGPGEEEK